jgi:hypothetical protein
MTYFDKAIGWARVAEEGQRDDWVTTITEGVGIGISELSLSSLWLDPIYVD